jgi:CysZ protein
VTPDDAAPAAAAPPPAEFILRAASDGDVTAVPRPGRGRRFAAGAWHVLGGAAFLLQWPRLWGLAVLPALLGMAAMGAGLILGIFGVRDIEAVVHPYRPRLPDVLDLIGILGLWGVILAAAVLLALSFVFFLCAPLIEWLERRTEALHGGAVSASGPDRATVAQSYRHAWYLIVAVPPAFAIALLPFVGPLLSAVLIALVLSLQLTAPALARRGRNFAARREWHGRWRAEMLGFGIAALILLPLLSPILAPALAVGAARLVREIEGDPPPPA